MQRRTWTAEQLQASVKWLARENALGKDIYFRPTDTRYVLLDDVPVDRLDDFGDGLAPSLVAETSPGNCQVWLDLGMTVTKDVRSAAGRQLAEHFDADPASTDWAHLGRLPGYTNQKPKHQQADGLQPFVRLRQAAHVVCEAGAEIVSRAKRWIEEQIVQRERAVRLQMIEAAAGAPIERGQITQAYRSTAAALLKKAGQDPDLSKIDYSASIVLLKNGFQPEQIEGVLKRESPQLIDRKSDPDDYVRRTVAAAGDSDAMRQHREAIERQRIEAELKARIEAERRAKARRDNRRDGPSL